VHQRTGAVHPLGHGVGLLGDLPFGQQRPKTQAPAGDGLLLLQHHGQAFEGSRGVALAGVALGCRPGGSREVLVVALQQAVHGRLGGIGPGRDRLEQFDR
jgi:hypothetical protein